MPSAFWTFLRSELLISVYHSLMQKCKNLTFCDDLVKIEFAKKSKYMSIWTAKAVGVAAPAAFFVLPAGVNATLRLTTQLLSVQPFGHIVCSYAPRDRN